MKRVIAASLILVAVPVRADEAIVVVGSRTLADGAALTAGDLARAQPVTVLDALDGLAGVRAFQKGGAGGGSYLSVRGGEPNFTLVLLDGFRVGDPTGTAGGAFDFAQLAPAAVGEVRLARGGVSAVQGADALSGVVDVRLRSPGEAFAEVTVGADGRGAVEASATAGAAGLLASAGVYDSGDLTAGSDLRRVQGLVKADRAAGAVAVRGLLFAADTAREGFAEDSGGPRFAASRALETRDTRFVLAGVEATAAEPGPWRPRVLAAWSRQDVDADTPAIGAAVPAIRARSRFERVEASAELRRQTGALTLAGGAGLMREDGRGRGTVDIGFPLTADFDLVRDNFGLFGEATLAPAAGASVTVAVRRDDPQGQRPEWTGRASATLGIAYAGWSEGYKLPSIFALAYPLIANPDLKPERSRTLEAGLARGGWRVGVFRTRFADLIDFDPARFTNVNRARVTTRGVEAEARGRVLPDVEARASVTLLDVDAPTPLRQRPTWQGLGSATWAARPDLTLGATVRFNAAFDDSSVPTGLVRERGHAEVDLDAAVAVTERLSLRLLLANLTSADYANAVGFPAPGRVLRASLTTRF
jgi:outer membrane cobalamin receptor